MTDFSQFKISGHVATKASADWDNARAPWNLAVDLRPEAVAFPQNADDIASIVKFAAANGLKVTAQGTGHGAASLAKLDKTILIKTSQMKAIEFDKNAGTARIEPGVLARELGDALKGSGWSYLPGASPDVSLTGFSLGGGLGWLGRPYGFSCNHIIAAEVVTADGKKRRIDAHNDAELFWALRGGGGCHAIVTALHFSLVRVPEVYAGALIFPAELGAQAVRLYRDWSATVPDTVSSIIRFLRPPNLPAVPEPLRNRLVLTITVCCIGSQAEGEKSIAALRQIGTPIVDTFQQMLPAGLTQINMDPEEPFPNIADYAMVRELSDEAIDAFVDAVGPNSASPLLFAELRHLGGAYRRKQDSHGALASLESDFIMFACGVPMTPELAAAVQSTLGGLVSTLKPWAGEGGFVNFTEAPGRMDEVFSQALCARLVDAKKRWDPNSLIVGKLQLDPAP